MLNKKELLEKFNNGETNAKGSNLYIVGNKLINYNTCIAYRTKEGKIILNAHKYSSTTSKNQTYVKWYTNVIKEFKSREEFKKYIEENYNEYVSI